MGLFNWLKKKNIPLIGRDISWEEIIGHVFKVIGFDKDGTVIDSNGNVKTKNEYKPYGYLLVDSPKLEEPIELPIIHRDDFLLASSVFDDPKLSEEIKKFELLVTYVPKDKLPGGMAGVTHALHYVITLPETINYYYKIETLKQSPSNPEKLFVRFAWEGEIRVETNLNPDL